MKIATLLNGVLLYLFWAIWIMIVVISVPLVRVRSFLVRKKIISPRIALGPGCCKNQIIWRDCAKEYGYHADCVSYQLGFSDEPGLFEYDFRKYVQGRFSSYAPCLLFLWVLWRYDVFFCTYTVNGYLRGTPFVWYELPMLHAAGKKIVATPFGSDYLRKGDGLPDLPYSVPEGVEAEAITRRIEHTDKYADFVPIGAASAFFLPRVDFKWISLAMDIDSIRPKYHDVNSTEEIIVLHATNHPQYKGTEAIEKACAELAQEGYGVKFVFITGQKNNDAMAAYGAADIIVDTLLEMNFGLFGLEAMALGKPLLCNVDERIIETNFGLSECPVVLTNVENVKENIRKLLDDRILLREIGVQSRAYVESYHSFKTVGRVFDEIYKKILYGQKPSWEVHPDSASSGGRDQ